MLLVERENELGLQKLRHIINDQYRSKATLRYYRIGNFFYRHNMKALAYVMQWIGMRRTGNDIASSAAIDKSVHFPHPIGIVIGSGVKIEKNVIIHANVIIGGKPVGGKLKYPIIRGGGIIYGNSCLLGNIVLHKNSVIGAGSVVLNSTHEGKVYAGCPAKEIVKRRECIIKKREMINEKRL